MRDKNRILNIEPNCINCIHVTDKQDYCDMFCGACNFWFGFECDEEDENESNWGV